MSAVTIESRPSRPQQRTAAQRPRHLHLVGAPVERPAASQWSLTVRGRRVIAAGALALLAATGSFGVARAVTGGPVATPTVTVQQGQTLDQIAAQQLPGLPLREAVVRIQLANSLNSLQIQPGQQLRIPR
ncbi:LysM peptidoglycan-binding domain-containing protein [Calidifontibacter sp. DB0510]|uniref:LysM peptidoglycan-binding domain-containing protein n=1 Tax=Metallococcus carri TaxID=1656884 RepID=A0A967AZP2_9MICO|nr:LysM peptidoglycan-binding domain-containing protein [Metallococcus carri]NHN56076.1 LysM peptidoglycan-binding domain-containing protein [Metallococcus carri]NOP37467.1 LysM peptidoglycan-binding domain-containing protein [Calidifontibacter sp. DB2511S]